MFGLGPTELIIILVIALIIFGPRRLPEMGSAIGKSIREFKKSTRELKDEIDVGSDIKDIKDDIGDATGLSDLKKDIEDAVKVDSEPKGTAASK